MRSDRRQHPAPPPAGLEPTPDGRRALVERFFSRTGDSYDFIVNATTFGADRRWKRRIVDSVPRDAARILDLACGTGILTFALAERFPNARVVGVELRDEYLRIARRRALERGIGNVEFVLGRAEDHVAEAPYDAIVSSYLAKYAELEVLVRKGRAMLNPGGLLLMHDFSPPATPYTRRLWRLQFALIQGLFGTLFPTWRPAFDGLPCLIERTRWVTELAEALPRHGFRSVEVEEVSIHGATIVSARAPGGTALSPA